MPKSEDGRRAESSSSGARMVSVFGAFDEDARFALVMMPIDEALKLTGTDPKDVEEAETLNAIQRDLERIRRRSPELADSALAASAVVMAREIENPYNSATSKSYCQARLVDALRELRELAPPEEKTDALDEVGQRRADRRARQAAAANQAGS